MTSGVWGGQGVGKCRMYGNVFSLYYHFSPSVHIIGIALPLLIITLSLVQLSSSDNE